LKQNFPSVEVLQLDQNYGFAKGYNEALKRVKAAFFILLNSDVEVSRDWIAPVIDFMQQNTMVAACQPKILAYHNKEMFEYAGAAGGWMDSFGYPFSRGRVFEICEPDHHQYDDVQKIFWASGAAMFIRSEAFFEAGGFDEYFFAHMEEIDLCWRLHLLNYDVCCIPQSTVYHVGGGTLPKGNSRKTFLNFRNNQIMMWKNMKASEKWWKIPFRIFLDLLAGLKGLLSGDGGYFLAIVKAQPAFFYWLFKGPSYRGFPKKLLKNIQGVYHGNIVFQYFIAKKKTFSKIIGKS
jgi:GT2 family glycosyltransferase